MPDYNFFRFGEGKSWHLLENHDETYTYARCGRKKAHPVEAMTILPGNEKTCERCLVFAARDTDSA